MASRLVPLNKNPGLRPLGVGEVLRRVMGKVVMSAFSEDVTIASSDAQMCGRRSGSEAAIHAMRRMFQHENSDPVIFVDAANTFNSLNRKVFVHNIKFICPEIAAYVNNCYSVPARSFVNGGLELVSREGSPQGDPLGMAIYAIGITPILDILVAMQNDCNKMVGFADDATAFGNLEALRRWWDILMQIGPNYGYYPQPTKSWLIVKENKLEDVVWVFGGTNIQITTKGKRHLGTVIGTEGNKKKYINDNISEWKKATYITYTSRRFRLEDFCINSRK